jgi:hypothetical protein
MAMPETTPKPRGAARTLSVIAGAIAGFLAVGLLIAGGVALWANAKKDDAGYISTKTEHFSTNSYAIATDNLEANLDAPHWIISQDHYGKVRLNVTPRSDKPVFVGIAPTRDVQAYLGRTAHETLTDVSYPSFDATYAFHGGRRPPAAPTAERFWAASTHGKGRQTLSWTVHRGSWSIVVMNADGSAGVDTRASAGARLPFLGPLGWSAAGAGLFLLVVAGGLMYVGLRTRRPGAGAPGVLGAQPAAA